MNTNNNSLKSSVDSNEFDNERKCKCCHKNCYRLLFVIILSLLSIVTTTSLILILYKDALKQKYLDEKRKDWIEKWKMIEPYVKKFPLGFILAFIRNLIVLAIERQIRFQ